MRPSAWRVWRPLLYSMHCIITIARNVRSACMLKNTHQVIRKKGKMLFVAEVCETWQALSSSTYMSRVAKQGCLILGGRRSLKWPNWPNAIQSDLQCLISGQWKMTSALLSQQNEVDFSCKSELLSRPQNISLSSRQGLSHLRTDLLSQIDPGIPSTLILLDLPRTFSFNQRQGCFLCQAQSMPWPLRHGELPLLSLSRCRRGRLSPRIMVS